MIASEYMLTNVIDIYNNHLCCSCGMCSGICTTKAIHLVYDEYGYFKPVIDQEKCTKCRLCLGMCPGWNTFCKNDSEKPLGNEKYYVGYSKDLKLRNNSASGGITTEVLKYLIEKKIVDKCVVVPDFSRVEDARPLITDDINIIYLARGSKYCPIPLGDVLHEIKHTKLKYALVAVPCQIQVIAKYIKDYDERIILISLFCNHCSSANATRYLLSGIDRMNVKKISYRGAGWPGKIIIDVDNRLKIQMPFRSLYLKSFGKFFYNDRCRICNDPFGIYADFSMADAFNCSKEENGCGQTLVFVRNAKSSNILNSMHDENKLEIKEIDDYDKILKYFPSQKLRTRRANEIINSELFFNKKYICPKDWKVDNRIERMKIIPYIRYKLKIIIFKFISRHESMWKLIFCLMGHGKEIELIEYKEE